MNRRTFLRAGAILPVIGGLFAMPTFAEARELSRAQVLRAFNIPASILWPMSIAQCAATGVCDSAIGLPCARCGAPASEPISAIQTSRILNTLDSEMFLCPGEKWMEHERMGFLGVPLDDSEYLGSYDSRGRCINMVRVWYDRWPTEFGGMPDGELRMEAPCADIHGLNDDTGSWSELETRYSERKQLLKKVKAILDE